MTCIIPNDTFERLRYFFAGRGESMPLRYVRSDHQPPNVAEKEIPWPVPNSRRDAAIFNRAHDEAFKPINKFQSKHDRALRPRP